MQRIGTESGLFQAGNPATTRGTIVTSLWANSVQEELAAVVEAAGLVLDAAGGVDNDQLLEAIQILIAAISAVPLGEHAALQTAHGSTSAATASKIMQRDASGRAQVAAPAAAEDIARKDTVDTHAALQTAHGSTSAATASKIMQRDASGRAKVAAPAAADDIARKDTVDNAIAAAVTPFSTSLLRLTVGPGNDRQLSTDSGATNSYTNTSGRIRWVSVLFSSAAGITLDAYVGGVHVKRSRAIHDGTFSHYGELAFPVPAGVAYYVEGSVTLNDWSEFD